MLVLAIVCFAAGGIVSLHPSPRHWVGMAILGLAGMIFLGLFLFGSARACQKAALLLTLGGWSSWS